MKKLPNCRQSINYGNFFVVFCNTKIVEKNKLRCIMKVLIHKALVLILIQKN